MFFVQVKAAGILFNLKATCGGCDSFLIFHHLKNKIRLCHLAAAGDAIDRLEGDSKIDSCLHGRLGKRWLSLARRQQKNN